MNNLFTNILNTYKMEKMSASNNEKKKIAAYNKKMKYSKQKASSLE